MIVGAKERYGGGTPLFASLAEHQGRPTRPIDDIESLWYSLAFLAHGSELPCAREGAVGVHERERVTKSIHRWRLRHDIVQFDLRRHSFRPTAARRPPASPAPLRWKWEDPELTVEIKRQMTASNATQAFRGF